MFIVYSGAGDQYASAAVSKRNGTSTSMEYKYLGRVIDREAGIYQSKERGVFTFDPSTDTFGEVPEDFTFPARQKRKRVSVDFGDSFFLNQFLWQSGMMKVVDEIGYGNTDTLHAMLLFYTLSGLANVDAIHWYEGNIVQLLYLGANMTSQRISDFLAAIGTPEKQMAFQTAYISYVMDHYSPDKNILIDSSGLPNGIHMPATRINVHNGKVSNQKCTIYQNRIVTDDAQKEANDTYAAFGMKCSTSIPVVDGVLKYDHPESDYLPPEKKNRKRKKTAGDQKNSVAAQPD